MLRPNSALAAYTQQLRLELGPQGVHVLLVSPGPIAREDASQRYADQLEGLPSSARKPGAALAFPLLSLTNFLRQFCGPAAAASRNWYIRHLPDCSLP